MNASKQGFVSDVLVPAHHFHYNSTNIMTAHHQRRTEVKFSKSIPYSQSDAKSIFYSVVVIKQDKTVNFSQFLKSNSH